MCRWPKHWRRKLDVRDVQAGVTVGGPGEILKCPDSESAFAMLESFIVLYEVTGACALACAGRGDGRAVHDLVRLL